MNRGNVFLAVCSGILLGSAFLLYKLFGTKKRLALEQEIERLGYTIAELEEELKLARARNVSSRRSSPPRSVRSFKSARGELTSNYTSDNEEDEYFDVSGGSEDEVFNDEGGKEVDSNLEKQFEVVDLLLKKGSLDDRSLAFSLLTDILLETEESCPVLWRLAQCCYGLSSYYASSGDQEKRKEFILKGLDYAKQALKMDSSEAEAHKWFAILTGEFGDFVSVKEKIEGGSVFKAHIEKAITLQPDDGSLQYLLGRFKFEIANLSWIERKIAGTIISGISDCTISHALENFMTAKSLTKQPWKSNSLYLAKCHIANGNYTDAVKWLDEAAAVSVNDSEDERAEQEIQKLLASYGSHRK